MADRFESFSESPSAPAQKAVVPVASDTEDLADFTKAIHVNTAGNVVGILVGDTVARTFTVVAGAYYPYRFRRILTTGTTATLIAFV